MTDPAEFEERADPSETERRQMSDAIRLKAALVREVIREEGEEELARSVSALAWSGLAAGLSMGFSLAVEGLLHRHLPDAAWRPAGGFVVLSAEAVLAGWLIGLMVWLLPGGLGAADQDPADHLHRGARRLRPDRRGLGRGARPGARGATAAFRSCSATSSAAP